MGFNDINLQVSGPQQPASIYKTKVLKGQVPFATQVTEPNTKYVIKHNFVLDGDVTIPENCILEFDGGSVSGHKIDLGNSRISNDSGCNCFFNCKPYSTQYVPKLNVLWFGFRPENIASVNTTAFNELLSIANLQGNSLTIYIPGGEYVMNGINKIDSSYKLNINGDGYAKTVIRLSEDDKDSLYLLRLDLQYSKISDITFRGNTYNWESGKTWSENPNTNLFALVAVVGFDVNFYNCAFKGSSMHGVYLTGINTPRFFDCVFEYNLGFGALVHYARGAKFENPWCELNYMGGILHSIPFVNKQFDQNNRIIIKGGTTENNGKICTKGSVKNYKGEDFEYQDAFVVLDNTMTDVIIADIEYATSEAKNIVVKPAKYKVATLSEDTIISFVDSKWNDFIVYERNGLLSITFDKNFLAGDKIRIYDYQQDIVNQLDWEYKIEQTEVSTLNSIVSLVDSTKLPVIVDADLQEKNYEIIGSVNTVSGLNYLNKAELITFNELNDCNTSINGSTTLDTYKNPIFKTFGVYHGQNFWNPLTYVGDIVDKSDTWLYVFGNSSCNFNLTVLKKPSLEEVKRRFSNPNGNFCVEIHLGDISDCQHIQINCNSYLGYGVVLSEKRMPVLNGGIRKTGRSNQRPSSSYISAGYQYFDTQISKPIWFKGVESNVDIWVDATGATV